ncbi:hypothetical protein [Pseudorhizobium flavum]|uniref:hypothetical protein n=1 Tax=Pseudorhizobium flavum TaxID=1335061 RepID=UPI002492CF0A|nr:hypothetical protein [Pseudorhizobium flavum]
MISDLAAWLFALLVVNPINAEIRERIETANLPLQAFQQSQQCLATHGPWLLAQAENDPVWAVGTAIGITTGWTSSTQLLDTNDPDCLVLTRLLAHEGRENTGS